jgi:hypothetical protein
MNGCCMRSAWDYWIPPLGRTRDGWKNSYTFFMLQKCWYYFLTLSPCWYASVNGCRSGSVSWNKPWLDLHVFGRLVCVYVGVEENERWLLVCWVKFLHKNEMCCALVILCLITFPSTPLHLHPLSIVRLQMVQAHTHACTWEFWAKAVFSPFSYLPILKYWVLRTGFIL